MDAKILSLEIEDTLRDFQDRTGAFASNRSLEKATEPLSTTARFKTDGLRLFDGGANSPFAPLFVLQSLGYGWLVDSAQIPLLPARFEPKEGDVIGTWLAPPRPGWLIPTMSVEDPAVDTEGERNS